MSSSSLLVAALLAGIATLVGVWALAHFIAHVAAARRIRR